MKRLLKNMAHQKLEPELADKLNADASDIVSRNTMIMALFCCVVFVAEELTRVTSNRDWFYHVLIDSVVITAAAITPIVLRKLKVRQALVVHVLAILYIVSISTVMITFQGDQYGGITVWGNLLVMVLISLCYYSTMIFWVYSFVFGMIWITIFTVHHPYLVTYIDLSDHVGRYAIFLLLAGVAFWGNKMIRQQALDNHRQLLLIQKYSKELEEKNAALQKLDRQKNEFLANTTHELKTPLHSIIGLLDPLLEDKKNQLDQESLYDITLAVFSAKRLSGLVGDILDFSKLRNKDIVLNRKKIDPYTLVDMVCRSFEPQIKKNVQLINKVDRQFGLIFADENRFLQILFNLIGNAVKFTESGTIKITAERNNQQITICVADTGIGIDEEKIKDIFNPFEQADTSISREYGGTGLGLTITKSLLELHGGKLWVNSKQGEGSRFGFSLPTENPTMQVEAESKSDFEMPEVNTSEEEFFAIDQGRELFEKIANSTEEAKNETLIQDADRKQKILIVDDEPINIRIISNLMEKEGYFTVAANNGKEALECLNRGEEFDLVLLDVMMPQLSGFDVCSEIRKSYTLAELPVLLLTAKDMTEEFMEGFAAGANDYLQKPFNRKELKARVTTLLELKKSTERSLAAEIYFLQSQIKPHFLYNTLNTIVSYIRTDADLAREMILQLSEYLQENFSVDSLEKTMPLAKEISIIKAYLFIEKARFQDKLQATFEIEEGIQCSIPHLILQPIVENAVRHGILPKASGGTIHISVKRQEHSIVIAIEDNGVGMEQEIIPKLLNKEVEGVGIGIYNIHRRMIAIYGHGLEMDSQPEKGTTVRLRIPC